MATLKEYGELSRLRNRCEELEAENAVLKSRVNELTHYISSLNGDELRAEFKVYHQEENESKTRYYQLRRDFDGKILLATQDANGVIRVPSENEWYISVTSLKLAGYEILE